MPIALIVFGILTVFRAFGGPPYPPEERLNDRKLATDDDSIIEYLSHGFPASAVWYHDSGVTIDVDVWRTYESLFDLVAQRRIKAAATPLRLALSDPLPSHLEQAIQKNIAQRNPRSVFAGTYDAEVANMRSWIAMTLARLGDAESTGAIKALLARMKPVAHAMLSSPADSPARQYTWAYTRLCEQLAALGDKESVSILLDCLPITAEDYTVVVTPLKRVTGQNFGPHWGMPHRFHAAELRKWTEWWSANRETFTPNPERILNPYWALKDLSANPTIREYVCAARDRIEAPTDTYITQRETTATNWLAANAGEHEKELLAIANDPDELVGIRSKALIWYASGAGKRALPTLERYAFERVRFDPADRDLQSYMASAARNIVLERFPESRLAVKVRKRDEELHRAATDGATASK